MGLGHNVILLPFCISKACCSMLQCISVCCSVLQCVAVCCSVFQCVAVCCSVLQCLSSYRMYLPLCVSKACCSMLQCISVLQCVAFVAVFVIIPHVSPSLCLESVLQYVAVCFSVLQCVTVCCSVLQCVACCSIFHHKACISLSVSLLLILVES